MSHSQQKVFTLVPVYKHTRNAVPHNSRAAIQREATQFMNVYDTGIWANTFLIYR